MNNHCDPGLEHSNPVFSQDTPVYGDVYQTKLGCKRTTSSEDTLEAIMSDYVCPHCDLYLDDTEQTIPNTLWPMMMDHQTFFFFFFFGYKSLHVFRRYPEVPDTKLTSKQEGAVSFRDSTAG